MVCDLDVQGNMPFLLCLTICRLAIHKCGEPSRQEKSLEKFELTETYEFLSLRNIPSHQAHFPLTKARICFPTDICSLYVLY